MGSRVTLHLLDVVPQWETKISDWGAYFVGIHINSSQELSTDSHHVTASLPIGHPQRSVYATGALAVSKKYVITFSRVEDVDSEDILRTQLGHTLRSRSTVLPHLNYDQLPYLIT